jgi:predicted PurR-regulated permease PerM
VTARRRDGRRVDVHFPESVLVRVIVTILLVVIAIKLWLAFLLSLVSVLLAVTLDPVVLWTGSRGLKRNASVLAVAIAIVIVIGTGIVLIVPPLSMEVDTLVRDFVGTRDRIEREFPAESPILKGLVGQILALPDSHEVRSWFGRPLVCGRGAVVFVSAGLVVLMSALYLLADGKRTYAWLLRYVPRQHRGKMAQTASAVTEVVRSALEASAGTVQECAVEKGVIRGEPHDAAPPHVGPPGMETGPPA